MYKIMNAYMSKVQLQSGPELQQRLCDIVNSIKEIKSFSVTEHFKQFAIDMKLESFSVDRAAAVFHELQGKIANPYSSFYVRFNEGRCVRYRFITCKEDKHGIYCDFIFS